MEESNYDKLNSKDSFSQVKESLINKNIKAKDQEVPQPKKKKDQISFLDEGEITKQKLPKQVLDLIVESIPNVATMLGVFYYNFINMFFVKSIGDSLLVGSFGMGVTWFNSTTLCLIISLGNGLFIQLAQAYGAKNFKLMAELYQRSQAIECSLGVISSLLLYNTRSILLSFGISEEISTMTERFSVACIPSVFASILYDTTRQLLMAQNIFDIPMNVQLLVYFVHPFWCYLFTEIFDFGIFGIGIARCFSEYFGYFLLCYIIKTKHLSDETWKTPYNFKEMFKDWIPFLKISIPVGCLVFLEWIFFEFQTILVGRLNNDKILAGQTSFSSIIMFFAMVPLGLSATTNSYLGNAVGEGKKQTCLNLSKISMISCLVEVISLLFIGELLKDFFSGIFNTDPEMEYYFRLAYNMYLYTFLLGEYYQIILNGILRCCDLQNFAAYSCFIVFYFFGLPLTYILTFKFDLGLVGVWISQSTCTTAVSIIFYLRIRRIDWDESIQRVQQRVQLEKLVIDIEMNKISNSDMKIPSNPHNVLTAQ